MSLEKVQVFDYLRENITYLSDESIMLAVEQHLEGEGKEVADYEDVSKIMKILLKGEVKELSHIIKHEINNEDIEYKEYLKDSYSNVIFIPLIITLISFFPVLILGKFFGINGSFIAASVFSINILYIMISSASIYLKDMKINKDIEIRREELYERFKE